MPVETKTNTKTNTTDSTTKVTNTLTLINTTTEAFSKLIAGILTNSNLTASEIRDLRDQLSADTHSIIAAELAKLEQV